MNFSYDENAAMQGGLSEYISETGAYVGRITKAKWVTAQSGAEALELSFETEQGEQANYLSLYYLDKSGKAVDFQVNLIQAIMGCCGVKNLSRQTSENGLICPELLGRPIGLFLQKVLYTKQDGLDGFRLSIVTPYSAKSGKTLSEGKNGEEPKRIAHLTATMKDKDEREKPKRGRPMKAKNDELEKAALYKTEQTYTPFDDDIPF